MSLAFATTAKVTVTDASNLLNWDVGTLIYWVYRTGSGASGGSRVEQKGLSSSGIRGWFVSPGTPETTELQVRRATADISVIASLGNFSAEGTNKWACWAATWDAGGADGDQIIAIGDLTTALAEPSSYTTQVVGSGSTGDNTGHNLIVGNHPTLSLAFPGRLAIAYRANVHSTLAQMQALQFRLLVNSSNVKGLYHLGWNGTSTQPDWSGSGNPGTVTSATLADHVPLGPAFGYWRGWQGNFTAAAASPAGTFHMPSLFAVG